MKVLFADEALALIETERAGETRLPVTVIKSARRKLITLKAAHDDRTLLGWKSLHYEKLQGSRDGQRSVRLNDRFRLLFELDNDSDPKTITILEIEDYR